MFSACSVFGEIAALPAAARNDIFIILKIEFSLFDIVSVNSFMTNYSRKVQLSL